MNAAEGTFSTRTTLYDMAGASRLADLEEFTVYRNGSRIHSIDFNFWGVTFARDSNRFYATLGTAGHTYLVRGDIDARRVEVLRDGVECPSRSPDGTRIAFKQRAGSGERGQKWRPAALDLATLEDHPLAEPQSIDDQFEWLDDAPPSSTPSTRAREHPTPTRRPSTDPARPGCSSPTLTPRRSSGARQWEP